MDAPAVIDAGSDTVKAGFAGDEAPTSVFPSVVGHPWQAEEGQCLFGDEAVAKQSTLRMQRPIQNGRIVSWDNMLPLLSFTLTSELCTSPPERPILLADSASGSEDDRAEAATALFESLGVPALYIKSTAALALHASGRRTGMILESGYDASRCVPIYEGEVIRHAVRSVPYAGRQLSELLHSLLAPEDREPGIRGIIDDVKRNRCFVAEDYEAELEAATPEREAWVREHSLSYELPNGRILNTFGDARFRAPEALFRPSMLGLDAMGLQDLVYDVTSLSSCDEDQALRREFLENITLSGRTTLFPALTGRLELEIARSVPGQLRDSVRVHAQPERGYLSWIGGSLLALDLDDGSFNGHGRWCTKAEYDEFGPGIINRKCL
ncbi:Actin 1 [Mycena kentingensis (nom. inval.)]|nr:Actin 1 [Mycena kentingensis (nom. inval.)]